MTAPGENKSWPGEKKTILAWHQAVLHLLQIYINHWHMTNTKLLDYLQPTKILQPVLVKNTLLFVLSLLEMAIFSKCPINLIKFKHQK